MNFGLYLDKDLGRRYVHEAGDAIGRLDNNSLTNDNKPHEGLADHANRLLEQCKLTQESICNARSSLIEAKDGLLLTVSTTTRSLTGIGESNPTNVGFHLDWNTGYPIFPGSGLKGLTRAWALHWASEEELARGEPDLGVDAISPDDLEDYFELIFGMKSAQANFVAVSDNLEKDHEIDDKEEAEDVEDDFMGGVIFMDGLVMPDTKLIELDVMTPHSSFAVDGSAPADWVDPTPIPFLTLRAGARLQCGLIPAMKDSNILTKRAAIWLTDAIRELGMGAKTQDGLGRGTVAYGD